MWASCCGLLNEVMGTGAVRAQQPAFGAGAGPFRFAPSAGYSTYPPTSSGSAGQLCKACGLAFSVFRRKVNTKQQEAFSYTLLYTVSVQTWIHFHWMYTSLCRLTTGLGNPTLSQLFSLLCNSCVTL